MDTIPKSISKVAPDKCQTLFNWVPGQSMTLKLPDPSKWVGEMGVKTPYNPEQCWRVNAAVEELHDSITVSYIVITPDDVILDESSRRFRLEVGADAILLHQITAALDSLLEDDNMLIPGSDVVVSSSFSRTMLASPIIHKKSLANLVLKTRHVKQITGNPVYFVKNDKCRAKVQARELALNASEVDLSPSPFYTPKVVKGLLEEYRNKRWIHEWNHSGDYHSQTNRLLPYAFQTKQWFPRPYPHSAKLVKQGRPTLGHFIQFITGHGWFRRHRSKIDEDSSLCRFCNTAQEDPAHLWSTCTKFNGVRHAIRQQCEKDGDLVSFTQPFVWSVWQLNRFFRDPRMVELLSGPRTDQHPL